MATKENWQDLDVRGKIINNMRSLGLPVADSEKARMLERYTNNDTARIFSNLDEILVFIDENKEIEMRPVGRSNGSDVSLKSLNAKRA